MRRYRFCIVICVTVPVTERRTYVVRVDHGNSGESLGAELAGRPARDERPPAVLNALYCWFRCSVVQICRAEGREFVIAGIQAEVCRCFVSHCEEVRVV